MQCYVIIKLFKEHNLKVKTVYQFFDIYLTNFHIKFYLCLYQISLGKNYLFQKVIATREVTS